ncbi:MAG TPA: hypothetical protein VN426_09095 [Syntrophomonadaceae bacterium]|nr:hypothetical protein [Syntrophomonadaceae bacterium]
MLKIKNSIPNEKFEPGRLLVQFKPNVVHQDCLNTHASIGASFIQHMPELNIHVVSVESGKETEYINKYLSSNQVNHVEPDYYLFPDDWFH